MFLCTHSEFQVDMCLWVNYGKLSNSLIISYCINVIGFKGLSFEFIFWVACYYTSKSACFAEELPMVL